MIFYRKGDLKEALQVFQRVNDLQPGLADGWYQTGRVYEGLKNSDAAVLAYEKVLSLQPDASIAKRRLENLKRSP